MTKQKVPKKAKKKLSAQEENEECAKIAEKLGSSDLAKKMRARMMYHTRNLLHKCS